MSNATATAVPSADPMDTSDSNPVDNTPVASKGKKRKASGRCDSDINDPVLFAEFLHAEHVNIKKKLISNDAASGKRRLEPSAKDKLEQNLADLSEKLQEHQSEKAATDTYLCLGQPGVAVKVPWAENVFPVIKPVDPSKHVKEFKFDTEKEYFNDILKGMSDDQLAEFRALFQRNSAVDPVTLEVSCSKPHNSAKRENERRCAHGFTGEEDWNDNQKLARMLCGIFTGEITVSKNETFRGLIAKLMIAALVPKKWPCEPKPNSDEARSVLDHLWKRVGIMKLTTEEVNVNYEDATINYKNDPDTEVKYVLVYRNGFDNSFKLRMDCLTNKEDNRRICFFEDATMRWLKEMTKRLLLGTDQAGGWEESVPPFVNKYDFKNVSGLVYEFVKGVRQQSTSTGKYVGPKRSIAVFPPSEWGNPCIETITSHSANRISMMILRGTKGRIFINDLSSAPGQGDKEFWAKTLNIPHNESTKAFNEACQRAISQLLLAAYGHRPDPAGMAIVRRVVGPSPQAATAAASSASSAPSTDLESLDKKVDQLLEICKTLQPLAKLAPALLKKLTKGEVLDADDEAEDDADGDSDDNSDDGEQD